MRPKRARLRLTRRGRAVFFGGPLVLAGTAATVLLLASPGVGQEGLPATTVEPVLGPADLETVLMGETTTGETWGYRALPLDVAPPVVDGAPLEFGAPGDPLSPDAQFAFERHTDATGWQVFQTPADKAGVTLRSLSPNALSARMTPKGGGLLVGRNPRAPATDQVTVLLRDPSGRFHALPTPPATVVQPAATPLKAEALAGDNGTGSVVATAFDGAGDKTELFFAPVGRDIQDAIVRWDGATWTREPVCLPPDTPPVASPPGDPCPDVAAPETRFEAIALSAPSATNAWLLAKPDSGLDRGLVLFKRRIVSGQPRWEEQPLDAPRFADVATPAAKIADVTPLTGSADPLTVTDSGVWVDGNLTFDGDPLDFTVFVEPATGKVTGSWCDEASVCAAPLGARFSRQAGYRSFAWAGPGFGTRIITNPLDPGGDEQTNRGTYLAFDGTRFRRRPGAGGNGRRSGAFASVGDGWLPGPARVTAEPKPTTLTSWPVALRSPLTGVAPQPGAPPGALTSQALAVGGDGGVARYLPDTGWTREFLLTSSGTVAKPVLRAVAWPEPARAYAVGDLGAMWLWRSDTGLWEKDPAAPIGFEANLMGIAFDVANPQRGYAVGKGGALLGYDKTWTQEQLPAGFERADLTSVAFAGSQALVAAGTDLLVNDGGGWRVDDGVRALLKPLASAGPTILTVAGLPDGGAIAAGRDFVLERDTAQAPWRFTDQPLIDDTIVAAAPYRDGDRVRAVVSVVPRVLYPQPDELPAPDPNVPAPIIPPFPLAGDGYVLRETATGWRDEQRTAFLGSGADRPVKSDPVLSFALSAAGDGWAVGGWSGESDSAGRGNSGRTGIGKSDRARVQTGGVYRYDPGGAPAQPPAASAAPVPLDGQPIRLAVGGHASCESPCADLSDQEIAPDRTLSATLSAVGNLAAQPAGPRMLLYTGGRLAPGARPMPSREVDRFASLLGSNPALPVFPAVSAGDSSAGGATQYKESFASFGAPFGTGATPAGVTTDAIPGAAPGPGARTHYAFDSAGTGGTVRVIVVDNSAGSLAASDPYQNPAEPQRAWLISVLADAKTRGITSVVVGSRDLNTRFRPRLNVATDGDDVAQLLVDNGASAYFFERPEENRSYRIPAGGATTIPSFGTGTLGYRSSVNNTSTIDRPDSLFGDTGFLLAEIDGGKRDPATNRAPVTVRMLPIVDDVSLQAVDGTLIRRSRVALFQGLGRRPLSGDRWGRAGGSDPQPPGGDPYVSFPPSLCFQADCSTRITPEYRFTSSSPFVGDFVKVDPTTTNLRKPLLDANDKVITDPASGLFCAFNAGTTTITVASGGLSYAQKVTVLGGSVQRPCGTRPIPEDQFPPPTKPNTPPPPPPPPPTVISTPPPAPPPPPPAPSLVIPVIPPVVVAAKPTSPSPPKPSKALPAALPIVAAVPPVPIAPNDLTSVPPSQPPPPAPTPPRPIPPGGAVARVYQVEERRETELAPELQDAASRYSHDDHAPTAPYILGFIVLAAFAGAAIRNRPRAGGTTSRDRSRPRAAWATVERPENRPPPSRRRHPYR